MSHIRSCIPASPGVHLLGAQSAGRRPPFPGDNEVSTLSALQGEGERQLTVRWDAKMCTCMPCTWALVPFSSSLHGRKHICMQEAQKAGGGPREGVREVWYARWRSKPPTPFQLQGTIPHSRAAVLEGCTCAPQPKLNSSQATTLDEPCWLDVGNASL